MARHRLPLHPLALGVAAVTTQNEQTAAADVVVRSPQKVQCQAYKDPGGRHGLLLSLPGLHLRIEGTLGVLDRQRDARRLLDLATAALTTAGRLDPDEARHWTPPAEALEAVAYSMYCHGELPQLCDLGEDLFWAESADTPGARGRAADDAKASLDGIRDTMRRAAENGPEVAA